MRLISWNVNGLRAVLKKNFLPFIREYQPDILGIQETKCQPEQIPQDFLQSLIVQGYHLYWHAATKKGYSGVGVISKLKPLSVIKGLGQEKFDQEGRVMALEYRDFYFVTCYFPNAQHGLLRLDYKKDFNHHLLRFVNKLKKKKDLILCGDFNVAHEEIDLKNPKENVNHPGFYIEERHWFSELISDENAYVDTFRHFHPNEKDHYTWWSYRFNARLRNIGWRIDYFVVNRALLPRVKKSQILSEVAGSDHCPILLNFS